MCVFPNNVSFRLKITEWKKDKMQFREGKASINKMQRMEEQEILDERRFFYTIFFEFSLAVLAFRTK